MKIGKISPIPTDPKDPWCPFDALEEDDIFPILDYRGSCPNCETGKYPDKIMGIYKGGNETYHNFQPLGIIYCEGCGALLVSIAVMCGKASVDVTSEFMGLKK